MTFASLNVGPTYESWYQYLADSVQYKGPTARSAQGQIRVASEDIGNRGGIHLMRDVSLNDLPSAAQSGPN